MLRSARTCTHAATLLGSSEAGGGMMAMSFLPAPSVALNSCDSRSSGTYTMYTMVSWAQTVTTTPATTTAGTRNTFYGYGYTNMTEDFTYSSSSSGAPTLTATESTPAVEMAPPATPTHGAHSRRQMTSNDPCPYLHRPADHIDGREMRAARARYALAVSICAFCIG